MIEVEKTGETVATWYADPIWQKCKGNSPGVTVFKSDDVLPVPLAEPFRVDVLTCAVPYVNPNRRKPILLEKLEDTFNHRIGNILEVAAANGADNLVLDAFGCGAFNNPPDHRHGDGSAVLSVLLALFAEKAHEKQDSRTVPVSGPRTVPLSDNPCPTNSPGA